MSLTALSAATTIAVAAVATPTTADAQWRRGGWVGPAIGGFALGAIVGSAFALDVLRKRGLRRKLLPAVEPMENCPDNKECPSHRCTPRGKDRIKPTSAVPINPWLSWRVRFLRLPKLQKLSAMSDDQFAAIIGTVEQQSIHAQACLDLFEKDRGRPAYATSEVRNWADCQDPENLRFRILRRVYADQGWNKACKRIWNDIPAPFTSRPPIGQRIYLTLAEAARATGLSEVAVLDAIEQGRIVGMKDMQDIWHVDRATLCRAFPSASLRGQVGYGQIGFWERPTTRCGYAGARGRNVGPRQRGQR